MFLDIVHTTKEWILLHNTHLIKQFYNENNKSIEILLRCLSCNSVKKIDEVLKSSKLTGEEQYAY